MSNPNLMIFKSKKYKIIKDESTVAINLFNGEINLVKSSNNPDKKTGRRHI